MDDYIQLAVFDPNSTSDKIPKYTQLRQKNLSSIEQCKNYFAGLPLSVFVVLLFIEQYDSHVDDILNGTNKKKQIIKTFIGCDSIGEFIVDPEDACYITKCLIRHKINAAICNFLELESEKQFREGNERFSEALKNQQKELLKWVSENDKVEAFDIIAIPLNIGKKQFNTAVQRLKNICYDKCDSKDQFKIGTLFNYIPEDESDPDDESRTAYLKKRYAGDTCHFIVKSAAIRLYVVGDETIISNKWSQKLVATELDINQYHDLKYVDRCTFITHRPVRHEFTGDLVPRFGQAWQIQRAIAKRLDDIFDDNSFWHNLQHIHGLLIDREMMVNKELQQRLGQDHDNIAIFSSNIHIICQAKIGCEEKQEVGDINGQILSDPRQHHLNM